MKGIYLASYRAYHPGHDIVYQDKPFIVENVRNFKMFNELGLFDLPCFVYFIGRHTYWSNMLLSTDVPQIHDHIWTTCPANRQGGFNVHQVIEMFLQQL